MTVKTLIKTLPKAELHLHIEGSLEPGLMWQLAQKHGIKLPYASVEDIANAYQFNDLQSFLDIYYQGAQVLIDEDDFYQLMWAYLLKCKQDNIVHTEIMFDPQTHTERDIDFSVFMTGFKKAIDKAQKELGISVYLIMSFLRHLSEESAFETLESAQPYYNDIIAIGLDSSELGHPPSKFERVFNKARGLGFKTVAHAGEEGPPEYIWQALKLLDVSRVDHGVRSSEDETLLATLIANKTPLTVCPLSNLKLKVFDALEDHNLLQMLKQNAVITINSDDPSYFGGYLVDNFIAVHEALGLSDEDVIALCKNSIKASFLPDDKKTDILCQIDAMAVSN